jgi:glycosyltransferase involved in cell wall biosynthesis
MLAVFSTQLGASFINHHVEGLFPGRTVAVARYEGHPLGGDWKAPCPILFLDRWSRGLLVRLARRMGLSEVAFRDRMIQRFLRRHGVTVVLGEYLDYFLEFVPLLNQMKLPYVVQGHGIDLSAALRRPGMATQYLAYNSARAVLTRCEFHRKRLLSIGLQPGKVHVNPGGVNVAPELPQRSGRSPKRFIAVSRMATKKGPIYLLEAFRIAASRNADITLDFIGSGPLFPAVQQFVQACRLSDRVTLHGYISDETRARLLLECDVFVQHSITDSESGDEEGLPAAIQEAMAAGLPVVSTRHSGIGEAVEHEVTGLLVEEGDVAAMAAAMLEILPVVGSYGSAGYRKAAREYSSTSEIERLCGWLAPDLAVVEVGGPTASEE